MRRISKVCVCVLILALQSLNVVWASLADTREKHVDHLQAIIDARIAMYNKLYPEVFFVQLAGAAELTESLEVLQIFLGHQADNLDYEHPPELRQDLLYVNLHTIIMMLENELSSAALFRVGVNSFADTEYMCVITLTPDAIARDDAMATRDLMLDVSEQEFRQVEPADYLDHLDYLKFNIDHEAYHCLDSLYNGPRPMSMRKYWGEYMAYHHHQAADTFALAMYLHEHKGQTDFVRKIGWLRALSILYGDPDHYSYPIIEKLLSIDAKSIVTMSERQLFRLATDLREDETVDYEAYLEFISSAHETMARLHGKPVIRLHDHTSKYRDKLTRELLSIVQNSYKKLFGIKFSPAEAAP